MVGSLGSQPLNPASIPGAAVLEKSFILATSAIHLISVVPACLLGLTQVNVMLDSLIHPFIHLSTQDAVAKCGIPP